MLGGSQERGHLQQVMCSQDSQLEGTLGLQLRGLLPSQHNTQDLLLAGDLEGLVGLGSLGSLGSLLNSVGHNVPNSQPTGGSPVLQLPEHTQDPGHDFACSLGSSLLGSSLLGSSLLPLASPQNDAVHNGPAPVPGGPTLLASLIMTPPAATAPGTGSCPTAQPGGTDLKAARDSKKEGRKHPSLSKAEHEHSKATRRGPMDEMRWGARTGVLLPSPCAAVYVHVTTYIYAADGPTALSFVS